MTEQQKIPTSDVEMLKDWHLMAIRVRDDSKKQNDDMISYFAAMLSTQIYERIGEQEAQELRSTSQ